MIFSRIHIQTFTFMHTALTNKMLQTQSICFRFKLRNFIFKKHIKQAYSVTYFVNADENMFKFFFLNSK